MVNIHYKGVLCLFKDYDTLLLDNKSGLADPEAIDVHMMVCSCIR